MRPLKQFCFIDKIWDFPFLYGGNKLFRLDFSLFEKYRTIFVLRGNKNVWETLTPPPRWKINKDCLYTMIYPLSEATTAPRKVIIKEMVHRILSGRCWYDDQYYDIDLVTQTAIGIMFSIKSTSRLIGNPQAKDLDILSRQHY